MKKLISTLIVLLCADTLCAQDTIKSVNLDSISIKSKRITLVQSAPSGDNLDKKQLQIINTQNVGDAAKFLSGVTVKDYGGFGGMKTVSVRGLSPNHTSVTYDGVSLFDNQSGQIDLSKYSLSSVNSLALANAQFSPSLPTASSLASASSVNIETKQPNMDSSSYKGDVSLLYGSFNLFNVNTFLAFKLSPEDIVTYLADITNTNGRYPYKLRYGNNQQLSTEKQQRKNNDLFSHHGEINWYHSFSAKNSLKTKAYYYYSERGLPANVTLWYNNPKQRLWNKNAFGQTSFTSYLNDKWTYKNNLKFDWNYTRYHDPQSFVSAQGQTDEYTQQLGYMNNAVCLRQSDNLMLTLTNDLSVSHLDATTVDDNPLRFSSLTAFVVNYRYKEFSFVADVLQSSFVDNFTDTNKYRNYLSPFVSVKYERGINSITLFYKNIFRMPTFNELYYRRYGNTDLKPETTNQVSLSDRLQLDFGNIVVCPQIDVYYNIVRNKIVALPKSNLFLWSMLNYGKVDIYGIDMKAEMQALLGEWDLTLKLTYSFQKAINTDEQSTTYKQILPYMPEHVASAVFGVNYRAWQFGYTCLYVGNRYSLPENITANILKRYFDHSANLTFELLKDKKYLRKLSLTASINNIFNKQYEIVRAYPMLGRNFSIKLQGNF